MGTETKRKLVHISMAVFALAVGRLPAAAIVFCCFVALMSNAFVLPNLTKRALERESDRSRGYAMGILMYPGVLLLLSVVFYQAQIFLVIAWAAMAFGDGFAGVVGSKVKGPKLPWSTHKSWVGLIAFWLFGSALGFLWLMLLPHQTRLGMSPQLWALVLACGVFVAGLMETLEGFIDDNFIVPVSAAATSLLVYNLLSQPNLNFALPTNWVIGLVLVLLLTIGAIAARKITFMGGLVGGIIAWLIFLGGGLPLLSLLLYFFVVGTFASKWRYNEKVDMGLAQENKAIRGVKNAVANGGVAAVFAFCGWVFEGPDAFFFPLLAAASLVSAVSDTLSSEMGNLYGKRYVNAITLRPDMRGSDGAISLEGSLAGLIGALIGAILYVALPPLKAPEVAWQSFAFAMILLIAGLFGNYIDSVLGTLLQRKGYMTNDTVNFASTFAASLCALLGLFIYVILVVSSISGGMIG